MQPDSLWVEHVVKRGETLYSISRLHYGSKDYWKLIYEWNKDILGSDPRNLRDCRLNIDQKLIIRSDVFHDED